jgi:hypothetical protein
LQRPDCPDRKQNYEEIGDGVNDARDEERAALVYAIWLWTFTYRPIVLWRSIEADVRLNILLNAGF